MNGSDKLLAWSTPATTTVQYFRNSSNSNRSKITGEELFNNESHIILNDNDYYNDTDVPYPDFTQIHWVWVTFIVVYIVVIVLSIAGNFLVCITVYLNKKMHTAVNYYIVNLAICDLFVGAFVMPVKLLELAAPAEWNILNDTLCNFMMYSQTVFVFTSVLTLVATCIERYFAIVYPLESRTNHSKSRAKKILLLVWTTPCAVAGPFLYPAQAISNILQSEYGTIHRLTCFDRFSNEFRQGYYIFLFFFIYLLSLCFITGTCLCIICVLLRDIATFNRQGSLRRQESNRRKVAKMILVVVFSFFFCWTPYFLLSIITQIQTENFLQNRQYFFSMLCVNLLAFTNSCVNPFIYGLMSVRFRHGFRSIFFTLCCCGIKKLESTPTPSAENTGDNTAGATNLIAGKKASTKEVNRRCSCINNLSSSDSQQTSQEGGGGSIAAAVVRASNPTTNSETQSSRQSEINSVLAHNDRYKRNQLIKIREFWKLCRSSRKDLSYDKFTKPADGLFVMESLNMNGSDVSDINKNLSSSFTALIYKTKSRLVSFKFGKSFENHFIENKDLTLRKVRFGSQKAVAIRFQECDNVTNKLTENLHCRQNCRSSCSSPNLYSSFAVKSYQFKVYHSSSYHDFDQPAIILEDSVLSDNLMVDNLNVKHVEQTSL
ncbi:hypothetical protein CHUAL_009452 [Chamberlinius hualienensis]